MAKRVSICAIVILLIIQLINSQARDQPLREDIERNPENYEHIIGLAEDNKKFLSVKDKLEAEHFIPKATVEKAVKACHQDENCKNSELATKLEKLLNLEITMTLTKANHALTPTHSRSNDEIAGYLRNGNFRQLFANLIQGYHAAFGDGQVSWQNKKAAISKIASIYKDSGILTEEEHNEISNAHDLGIGTRVPGENRNMAAFINENRHNAPEVQRESYKSFAAGRIESKANVVQEITNNANIITAKKANLVGRNNIGPNVRARNVNVNVHRMQ